MRPQRRLSWICTLAVCGCVESENVSSESGGATSQVVVAETELGGVPIDEWAVAWGRWIFSAESCELPDADEEGSLCGQNQLEDSDVFFLAPGFGGASRGHCSVPAGKTMLVPIFGFVRDNAALPPEEWESEPEMLEAAQAMKDSIADESLRVDDQEIVDLARFSVEPVRFSYEVPAEPNWYSCNGVPGVSGVIEPAYVAGYFALIPPLSQGSHDLAFGAAAFFEGVMIANVVELKVFVE